MTFTVSVSELRSNISLYLERVMQGSSVIIRDEKRNVSIAQITRTSIFDKDLYTKTLKKAAGIMTANDHPEWKTKANVVKWLTKSRLSDERVF